MIDEPPKITNERVSYQKESGWKCHVAFTTILINKKDKLSFEGPKLEEQCNSKPQVNFSIV